jgi:putative methyltransferase (TIGR04325 family)
MSTTWRSELGTGPVADDEARHNLVMTFGYALARAAGGESAVSLLDWGGGIGHYAIYAQELLPGVAVEYHSRELPLASAKGRELVPHGTFHESDASALSRTYDLVFASGSLQYSEDWRATFRGLGEATGRLLLVTRLLVTESSSFVAVQRPRGYYDTEYPCWVLSRREFLDASALVLEREVLAEGPLRVPGAPEAAMSRGFLFRAKA